MSATHAAVVHHYATESAPQSRAQVSCQDLLALPASYLERMPAMQPFLDELRRALDHRDAGMLEFFGCVPAEGGQWRISTLDAIEAAVRWGDLEDNIRERVKRTHGRID